MAQYISNIPLPRHNLIVEGDVEDPSVLWLVTAAIVTLAMLVVLQFVFMDKSTTTSNPVVNSGTLYTPNGANQGGGIPQLQ